MSPITNLNSVRLRDLERFFRDQICRCDPENKIVSYAIEDTDDFSAAYKALCEKDQGAQLILMEDEFNLAFEKVLSKLDDLLNVFIDDSYEDFSSVNLSFDEGIRLIPGYADAENLLPRDSEGSSVFETLGYCSGHIWTPKDISLLIHNLQKESLGESIAELQMREDIDSLLHIVKSEQKLLADADLKRELFVLRKTREKLGQIYPLLINFIDPEASFLKSSRLVDIRDIINPLLEAEHEKRVMEEFSFNDFSHDSFSLLAERVVAQFSDDGSMFRTKLLESFGNYRDTVSSVNDHPLWKEYQEHELVWYQDIEQLFLTMNFAYGSIDANDPVRWKAHTETVRYQSAEALWNMLEHSPFDALFLFRRGSLIHEKQWEMMKNLYVGSLQQAQLEAIGGDLMFERALHAEKEALEILEKILISKTSESISTVELHKSIREKRYHLNAALIWARRLTEE